MKSESTIPKTPLRFFIYVSKPYWVWIFLSSFFVIAAALGDIYIRFFIEKIINAIEAENNNTVVFWALLYPVFYFGTSCTWRMSGYMGRVWLLGVPKLTTDILAKYASRHSHVYYSNRFAGSVGNKISNVTQSMEEFVGMFLWSYLENIIPLIATGVIFLFTDVLVGLLYFGLIVSSLILNILLMPRKRRFSLSLAATQSKTTGFLVDVISNIQSVRQFVGFGRELTGVQEHTADVEQKGKMSFLYSEYTMFLNSLLFTVFAVAMFIILLDKWQVGEVSSGRLVTFLLLTTYTAHTVIFLGRILSQTAKHYGKAQEGLNELLLPHDILDHPSATTLTVPHGQIQWTDVTFRHGEQAVFKDFNLTIPAGQRLGLIGSSGAGKSTFVSLLLRQHDIAGGTITIDGQPIHQVTQDSLRANIAVVPQEPALFHRTIRENIAYGKPNATDEEIVGVAKKAYAHDFIMELPEKYNTLVGERGVKLSGGQKQRIAIARAMLKDAPILILDEATSALDSESEVAIQKALHVLMAGKTVIAIAHRLSTLREMDRLVVLENGSVIEDGSHEALLQYDGTYAKLWRHQAGGFVGE